MNICKYLDCGWCYAPNSYPTNTNNNNGCKGQAGCVYFQSGYKVIVKEKA